MSKTSSSFLMLRACRMRPHFQEHEQPQSHRSSSMSVQHRRCIGKCGSIEMLLSILDGTKWSPPSHLSRPRQRSWAPHPSFDLESRGRKHRYPPLSIWCNFEANFANLRICNFSGMKKTHGLDILNDRTQDGLVLTWVIL